MPGKKVVRNLAMSDTDDGGSESSNAHVNRDKRIKATPPPTKRVRASAAKVKKPAQQLEDEEQDRQEVVQTMGVGAESQGASTPSSGAPNTPDFRKGSIPFRLQDHFDVGMKHEETGDRTITCKLCAATNPLRTMVVKNGQGFGNIGGHFRNHHVNEFEAAGCGEKCKAGLPESALDAPENDLEELLFMFARLRLPFSVIEENSREET